MTISSGPLVLEGHDTRSSTRTRSVSSRIHLVDVVRADKGRELRRTTALTIANQPTIATNLLIIKRLLIK